MFHVKSCTQSILSENDFLCYFYVCQSNRGREKTRSHSFNARSSDKDYCPVTSVFDDLKDYLSDSDSGMSLDYKIAVQRRKKKMKLLAEKYQVDQQEEEKTTRKSASLTTELDDLFNFQANKSKFETMQEEKESHWSGGSKDLGRHSLGTRSLDRSRVRRSPSVTTSETSTLEPIPEERNSWLESSNRRQHPPLFSATVTATNRAYNSLPRGHSQSVTGPLPPERSLTLQRPGKENRDLSRGLMRVGGQNIGLSSENLSASTNALTHVESQCDSNWFENDNASNGYGSLKRRKALKTASLSSLLNQPQTQIIQAPSRPSSQLSMAGTTFSNCLNQAPLSHLPKSSSALDLSSCQVNGQSLPQTTGLAGWQVDPGTKHQATKKWVSDLALNMGGGRWTPSNASTASNCASKVIVAKACSCGNKVTFDPWEDDLSVTSVTSTSVNPYPESTTGRAIPQ